MKTSYADLLAELKVGLRKFDIPAHRKEPANKEGLRWLAKHVSERNSSQEAYPRVVEILKELGYDPR